jgi:Flp pilus assembly protein TadG
MVPRFAVVNRVDQSARTRRYEAGTSVVEMAIVLPLLLLLVFGIGEFGVAYTRWNSLTNAVREGAREGVVFRNPCTAGTVTTLIETTVANFANSSGLDGASINTTAVGACTGTGTTLTVTSSSPYDYIVLDAFLGLAPTINLSARSVMRNE